MKKFIVILMLASLPTWADEVPEGVVEVNPKVYSPKKFKRSKRIQVKPMDKTMPHPDAIPTKEAREAVFARVPGLAEHTEKLDQLDRDLLYMRARNNTAAELQAKHPSIPPKILEKLQEEARRK